MPDRDALEALIRGEAALIGERFTFREIDPAAAVPEYRAQVAAMHGVPVERVGAWLDDGGVLRAVLYGEGVRDA